MKFLGGVLKYEKEGEHDTMTLDYAGHMTKIECIEVPNKVIEDERADDRTHARFRTIHG